MMENIISFTKIDIVQLKINGEVKHELPTDDFLQRLKMAIESDVSKHQVVYNSKNGAFDIYHNGKKYSVYYGDQEITKKFKQIDTMQALMELVELTKEQKIKQDYNGEVILKAPNTMDEIIRNGDEGIFDCEDDKVKYIEHCKKELSKSNVFDNLKEIFAKSFNINRDDDFGISVYLLLMFSSLAIFMPLLVIALVGDALLLAFLDIVACAVDIFLSYGTGYGFASTFFQFIYRLGKCGVVSIKNVISKIIKKRRLKAISESIIESELSENMSDKLPIQNDKSYVKGKTPTLKGEAKETVRRILAKLPLIKEKDKIQKYGERLEVVLELFKDIPPEEYNERYSKILRQLSYIDGEIGEDLKKELANNVIASNHETVMEQVDSLSDVQTMSKR